jgi:SAM-dependent methyltransferase
MHIANPSFNYDKYGRKYSGYRQTDPRIAAFVHDALGDAQSILNVGAGAGSYEPEDGYVVAIEPSSVMRAQRKDKGRVPAINAKADDIPFDDDSFDASMAMITIHHWPDIQKGLKELRRVSRDNVVIMTGAPDALDCFWTAEYFSELIAVERSRFPGIDLVTEALGGNCEILTVPIPLNYLDGCQEAFYGRPEAFLDSGVRMSQSAWGFLPEWMVEVLVARLKTDLDSGEWDRKYGHYRTMPELQGSLRLVISRPD